MFKKYYSFLILLVVMLFPASIFALQDSYYISMGGNYGNYQADYNWIADNGGSGYLRDAERASKTGLKCNENDVMYWYYKSKAVIKMNLSKVRDDHGNSYSSCDTYTVEGTDKASLKKKVDAIYNPPKQSQSNKQVKCTTRTGGTRYEKITKNNSTVEYQFGDDSHYVGNSNFGVWSKSFHTTSTYVKSNHKQTWCTWGDKSGTSFNGVKNLPQHSFSAGSLRAYCVSPGKAFVNQTHYKTSSFDTSNCRKSNDSYACALAASIILHKKQGNGDMAIQTTLRFIAAHYNQGSGIWDGTNTYSSANIFGNTASAARSNGYAGSTSASKGILYASGSNLTALQKAISVYKEVINGFSMWAPSAKVISSSYSNGVATLYVETNFDAKTNIKSVTLSDGTRIDYTKSACENNSSNTCMKITFNADESKIKNCNLKVRISYTHGGDEVVSRIGMYLPANNPSSYQQMIIYDTSGSDTFVEASLCGGGNTCTIKDGVYYGKNGTPVDKETYDAECNEKPTTCPDPGIQKNMPEDCSTDGTTGVIKDPNMCTILNSEENVKNDYKKDYGNEYCTVYCNETLTFSFMDKAKAISGRYFVHDVGSYYSNKQNLSTVILSSRQCTSLIDYDTWEKEYNDANDAVRTTWNEYKGWEAFYLVNSDNNGAPTRTDVAEDCTGTSCNSSSSTGTSDCTGTGGIYGAYWENASWRVTRDNGSVVYASSADLEMKVAGTINDVQYKSKISSGTSGLTLTLDYGTKNSCSKAVLTPKKCPKNKKTGTCGNDCSGGGCSSAVQVNTGFVKAQYASSKSLYDNAVIDRQTLINKINSCNFVEGSDAYNKVINYAPKNTISIDYAENTDYKEGYNIKIANEQTKNHVVLRGYANTTSWKEVCGSDCDGTLSNLKGTSNNGPLQYWDCTGSEKTAKCVNVGVTIPENRLANIVVNTETIHYQEAEFYTQVFSGKVSTEPNNTGYWIKLADNYRHLYPVSAFRLTGNYPIEVEYSNLGDQSKIRDMEGGTYTCSYDAINELTKYDCDDGYHVCYPCTSEDEECDYGKVGLGVYYRSVSLSDLFPHSKYSPISPGNLTPLTRNIGQNWITANAQKVVKEIQSNGDDVWITKKPMYTIKLTPSIMKNIRNYNSSRNYIDYSLSCNGLKCSSDFLQSNLRSLMDGKYGEFYSKDLSIKNDSLYYYSK